MRSPSIGSSPHLYDRYERRIMPEKNRAAELMRKRVCGERVI
jgi:hypothetical protein